MKLNRRRGDAAELAILEWVELPVTTVAAQPKAETAAVAETQPAVENKPAAETK